MGAPGQPPEHVFGADLGQRQRLEGAVEGRQHHGAAGLDQSRRYRQEDPKIGYVFHHLHVEDDVEAPLFGLQLFRQPVVVVDVEARLLGVGLGDFDRLLAGVDAGHRGAEPPHGFAQKPAAAADVEHV